MILNCAVKLSQFALIAFMMFIMVGCAEHENATSDLSSTIPASSLLIDLNSFPANWVISPCSPNCSRREGNSLATRFFYNEAIPGGTIQEVHREKSAIDAERVYTTIYNVDIKKLSPTDDNVYKSSIAQKFAVRCGEDIVPVCEYVGLYGNYVVYFYFAMDENGIKKENVKSILEALDRQIQKSLTLSSS